MCECLILLAFFIVTHASATTSTNPAAEKISEATKSRIQATFLKAPLSFEANQGQVDEQVKFIARGSGYSLFLTANEAVMVLQKPQDKPSAISGESIRDRLTRNAKPETRNISESVVRMKLAGANPDVEVIGLSQLPGKVNYFIGNDPKKWRTNIPSYKRVEYKDVYPGINLVFYGNQRQLEYDFVVSPGADPKAIKLAFEGADKVEMQDSDLVITTTSGLLRMHKPLVYQEVAGVKKVISGEYVLNPKSEIENPKSESVSLRLASYDTSRPLIVDPVLSYSTYLGGSGDDQGFAVRIDSFGNAYVGGHTTSTNFPILATNPVQATSSGGYDVFVAKLDSLGGLVWSTYLGGAADDFCQGIAVDGSGNTYLTGYTFSDDFPTANAYQSTFGGGTDAFITKLIPDGTTLVYSTYLGDSGFNSGGGIAADAFGNAYVGVNGYFASPVKLNAVGQPVYFSSLRAGKDGGVFAVDTIGNVYIGGLVGETTPGAYQPSPAGGVNDGYVAKISVDGSEILYATYLGGSGDDVPADIAVDPSGNIYVVGVTSSVNFPTKNAFQDHFNGGDNDAFVAKIDPFQTGDASLVFSTYLGGSGADRGFGVALDSSGNAYITGETGSTDLQMVNPLQADYGGGTLDNFIAKVSATGQLLFSTYLGGSGFEGQAASPAVDNLGNLYVTGSTQSTDFPTMNPYQDQNAGGGFDVFVAKIVNTSTGTNVAVSPSSDTSVTFSAVSSPGQTSVTTNSSGPTPPSGFTLGNPPIYYDLTTTATFSGPVAFCITYNPAQFSDPSSVRLFHFENTAWADVTTSNDTINHIICGQVSSFSVFAISEPSVLMALSPATVWIGLKNSDDVGIRFDLLAEVYKGGSLVGSGHVNSGTGGSSGFNNAKLDTIPLSLIAPVDFPPGSSILIKLYVRNACTGSGKNSGAARLWYNDTAANSQLAPTFGRLPRNYYLVNGFALANSPGPGPKKTIDVAAGAKCSPFKTFGTWSITP